MPASSPFTPSHRPTASSSQWLFAKSEVLSSPSVQAGWAPDQENVTRAKGIQLISEVGQKLRLQQTTIATAAMFFHRFYIRMSFIAYHHYVRLPFHTVSLSPSGPLPLQDRKTMFIKSMAVANAGVGHRSDLYIPSHQSPRKSTQVTRHHHQLIPFLAKELEL